LVTVLVVDVNRYQMPVVIVRSKPVVSVNGDPQSIIGAVPALVGLDNGFKLVMPVKVVGYVEQLALLSAMIINTYLVPEAGKPAIELLQVVDVLL
jgi:hypothetical protein